MDAPQKCTWLDLAAHDALIDDSFRAADKYEDYMHFLHDENGHHEEPTEKS